MEERLYTLALHALLDEAASIGDGCGGGRAKRYEHVEQWRAAVAFDDVSGS